MSRPAAPQTDQELLDEVRAKAAALARQLERDAAVMPDAAPLRRAAEAADALAERLEPPPRGVTIQTAP